MVLVAELARSVDAAHAEDRRCEPVGSSIVEHVLVGRALAAAVRTMELERTILGYSECSQVVIGRLVPRGRGLERDIVERAVDLVGGRVEDARRLLHAPRGLEHVQGSEAVDGEIRTRVVEARRHGDLRGEMEDMSDAIQGRIDRAGVAHVGDHELESIAMALFQPTDVPFDAHSREVVEDAHAFARLEQAIDHVRADEAGASGNEGSHSVNPLASSSARASTTRSRATWPSSQVASSVSPSSRPTDGS